MSIFVVASPLGTETLKSFVFFQATEALLGSRVVALSLSRSLKIVLCPALTARYPINLSSEGEKVGWKEGALLPPPPPIIWINKRFNRTFTDIF